MSSFRQLNRLFTTPILIRVCIIRLRIHILVQKIWPKALWGKNNGNNFRALCICITRNCRTYSNEKLVIPVQRGCIDRNSMAHLTRIVLEIRGIIQIQIKLGYIRLCTRASVYIRIAIRGYEFNGRWKYVTRIFKPKMKILILLLKLG